jgi:membrane protease YdiL (CAAX protease family)
MTTDIPLQPPPPHAPHRWQPGTAIRIIGPFLVVIASFLLSGIVYGLAKAFGLSDDSAIAIAGFAGSAAILGFGLLIRASYPTHERRLMTSRRWSIPAAVGIGLALGIGMRIAIGIIVTLGQAVDPGLCEKLLELDDDLIPPALWHKLLLAFSLVVLAPLGEELVFRGLLLRGLARKLPFAASAVISGVAFGLAHQGYWTLWPLLVGICGFGVVAAYVYRKMGFAANVAMHATFNLVVAIFLFVDVGLGDQQPSDCT